MTENQMEKTAAYRESLRLTCKRMREVPLDRGPDVQVFYYNDVQTVRAGLEVTLKEFAAAEARAAALQAFKDWVHGWLDAHGVPSEFPDGTHTKEGCRIGDRMDWLAAKIEAAEARVARLELAVEAAKEVMDNDRDFIAGVPADVRRARAETFAECEKILSALVASCVGYANNSIMPNTKEQWEGYARAVGRGLDAIKARRREVEAGNGPDA